MVNFQETVFHFSMSIKMIDILCVITYSIGYRKIYPNLIHLILSTWLSLLYNLTIWKRELLSVTVALHLSQRESLHLKSWEKQINQFISVVESYHNNFTLRFLLMQGSDFLNPPILSLLYLVKFQGNFFNKLMMISSCRCILRRFNKFIVFSCKKLPTITTTFEKGKLLPYP